MIRLTYVFLLLFPLSRIKAQTPAFDSLHHALLFNMYSGKPDSVVVPFLRAHFPYLVNTPEPGGWSVYPPVNPPTPQKGFHSVLLDQHPVIHQPHSGARLDIHSQEWPTGNPGIEKTRVWIFFPDAKAAQAASDSLTAAFRTTNASIEPGKLKNEKCVLIKPGMAEEDSMNITLVIKKTDTPDRFALLILFSGDRGESW